MLTIKGQIVTVATPQGLTVLKVRNQARVEVCIVRKLQVGDF